jgi:hypothetical protein
LCSAQQAIDLPAIDVDVADRVGNLRMEGQEPVEGQLELGPGNDAELSPRELRGLREPATTATRNSFSPSGGGFLIRVGHASNDPRKRHLLCARNGPIAGTL